MSSSQLPELPSRRSLRESGRLGSVPGSVAPIAATLRPTTGWAPPATNRARVSDPVMLLPKTEVTVTGPIQSQQDSQTSNLKQGSKQTSNRWVRDLATMAISAAMAGVWVLPSYGFTPEVIAASGLAEEQDSLGSGRSQAFTLAISKTVEFSRGEFEVSEAPPQTSATKELPRVQYDGPTARDYLKNPRFSEVTSENLMLAATELVGVPYVFGGATPGGIDCSGLVLFVYSQFGVKLPHSVYQQAKNAEKIGLDEAKPGDIVVFNDFSHNGIYAGNGMFIHAPRPGDRVKLAPIFTDAYHIIRLADIS